MNEYDYENPNNKFEIVSQNIWINEYDKTYHFSDETENFNGPYSTFEECSKFLELYIKHCL